MRRLNSFVNCGISISSAVVIAAAVCVFSGNALADSSEKVLYSFRGGSDGTNPSTGLVTDSSGNLYGTTTDGGTGACTGGCGTVFELKAEAGGRWIERVIYNFQAGTDGAAPSASLIFDGAGNLYGTTISGGPSLDGTVFQLTPTGGGGWSESVLHSFTDDDGAYLVDRLILDQSGNLYGTTVFGGRFHGGTAFQLSPPTPGGGWTLTTLHDFTGRADGIDPEAGLISDVRGALYGTTIAGNIFKIVHQAQWSLKVLYVFGGGSNSGQLSEGVLLFGDNGVLYGTQKFGGGTANAGAVYQLTPPAGGSRAWTETTIYRFTGGADGVYPLAGVIADGAGNLYGTTAGNGQSSLGTVYRLTPPTVPGGDWTETTLHTFAGGSDGSGPSAGLIFGRGGALYGATAGGGAFGKGTVFKVVP
jgi:uncharacterized repeat protein (TIGR03803 family)